MQYVVKCTVVLLYMLYVVVFILEECRVFFIFLLNCEMCVRFSSSRIMHRWDLLPYTSVYQTRGNIPRRESHAV